MKRKASLTMILVLGLSASALFGLQGAGFARAYGSFGAQVWIQSPNNVAFYNVTTVPLVVTAEIIYRSNSLADDQIAAQIQNASCQYSLEGSAWRNLTFVEIAQVGGGSDPIYNNFI